MVILEACIVEDSQHPHAGHTAQDSLLCTSLSAQGVLANSSEVSVDFLCEDFQSAVSPLCAARTAESIKTFSVSRLSLPAPPYKYDVETLMSSSPLTAVNSRAPSPVKDIDIENSLSMQREFNGIRWRLASGFFACFMCGWGDGVTGTVLPYLNNEFHLSSTLSSSLFAGTTCGFFAGTFLVETLLKILGTLKPKYGNTLNTKHSPSQGRHWLLLFSSILYTVYFVIMGTRSGFPAMFIAYVLAAFSKALLTAPLNAYFASGPRQTLGYGLGLSSLGSVVSPLICQLLIASGVPWFHFYFGSLVLSGLNIMLLSITFRPTSKELRQERDLFLETHSTIGKIIPPSGISNDASNYGLKKSKSSTHCALRSALFKPYQWAFSFFALLYCGSETTTQGFMVMFLLKTRDANPKTVGYVTSGFWGGITVGRFLWGYLTPYLSFQQRKFVIQAIIGIAIAMHLIIRFVNSTIASSLATTVIGALYGPILPAVLAMANDILPPEVHMVAMSIITSFASLGGAIFPLITGAILDAKGAHMFTSITVPLAAALAAVWALFPPRVPVKIMSAA